MGVCGYGSGGISIQVLGASAGSQEGPADKGMYFIWDLPQLNVRPYSRTGLLRYKITPKTHYQTPSIIPA